MKNDKNRQRTLATLKEINVVGETQLLWGCAHRLVQLNESDEMYVA